jgi:hypothetical protein
MTQRLEITIAELARIGLRYPKDAMISPIAL